MMRIMEYLDVFPNFLKYLTVFGVKKFPQDEGFAGYDAKIEKDESGKLTKIGLSTPRISNAFRCLHSIVKQSLVTY